MSTISLPYESQIRHFFVFDAVASETTIATFDATASIGELQIFGADGLTATTTGDFYIAKKNQKGALSVSDKITPGNITYISGVSPVSKVGKSQTFTLASAPTVGEEFILTCKVHYGNSEENFITFVAGELAVAGDTQDSILGRLTQQMADNLARSINTTSNESGTDVISGSAAAGSVQLTGGASGTVDSITVDGVELLTAAVAFNTDLDTTASDVADAINANVTVPNYVASVSTDTVTITSLDAGVSGNGLVVASGATTITTSDTNLAGGADGLSAKKNKYFTLEASNDAVVITEKDWILDDFRVGLYTNDQLMWNFEMYSPDTTENAKITKTSTPPVYAKGQGYQMIELERYLVGHRAEFDYLDRTLEFGRDYDVSTGSQYYSLDLKYYDTSRDDPKHSNGMLTLISTSNTHLNTIGNAIESRDATAVWTDL